MLAGIGGVGGAVMLAACSAAVGQNKAGNDPSGSAASGRPTAGGTLRCAMPDDLIPASIFTNSGSSITALIGLVYDSLIRYPNDKVVPEPRLATSWNLSKDGRTLSLQLRKGVKFHTGRPFTSKDVAFSIQTWADPKWTAQQLSSIQAIQHVDTSDPYTAVLHLAHPMSNIFDVLDTVVIVDKETISGLSTGKQYVGTGPFKFESWTPNSELVFSKNEHYWQPGRPYLDGVHISIVPDSNALLAQIKSGQVDWVSSLSFRDAETLSKDSSYTLIRLVGAEDQTYVGCNLQVKPLNDLRVRQAIAYAIDRDRIISEVFQGSGYAVNLPWPKYSSAWDEAKNKTYTYDPAKAKALVKQVGTIPTIQYTYQTDQTVHEAVAQIVQSNLADVGIKVELEPVDHAHFVTALIDAEIKGIWTTYHSWAQYTPSNLTVSAYPFNAAHNASHYTSPKYLKDANQAWYAPNSTSQAAVSEYAKVSDDLLSSLFLIEIGVVELEWVTTSKLKGVSYTKRGELDVTNAYFA